MRMIRVSLTWLAAVVVGLALIGGTTSPAAAKPSKQQAAKKAAKKKAAKRKAAKRKAKRKARAQRRAIRIVQPAPYTARGSVGDVYVENAEPGTRLLLVNAKKKIVRKGNADSFGSKIFYDVKPGAVFTVRTKLGKGKGAMGTPQFRALKPGDNPPQSFYETPDKKLHKGLNYVTMRDGTELAMTVRLPEGKTSLSQGPFPTFIEYSGYQTAAPHDALTGLLASAPGGVLPDQLNGLLNGLIGNVPGSPVPKPELTPATSTAVGSIIGPLLDFAVVSVQMRGSGCSGGAFDLFGWPTTYDGYDAIETVAAQDWVEGGKVSMGGISFSGITQLFTAGTRPPHLSAVAPLSVTDDVYDATGFPGGIFNNGFAYSWITERAEDAKPAPEGGQPWARYMTQNGDPQVSEPLRSEQKQHCIDNQKMRLQTRDYNHLIETNPFRTPGLFEKRSPGAWVKNIDVPVFWVGAFQDEQTGGHWPEAVKNLSKANSDVWVTMQNGVHVDSLGPSTITRWDEFMNLFTGSGRIPRVNPVVMLAGPVLYQLLAESAALPIEQSRYALWLDTPQNVAKARADFRKDPRIRVLMDNGAAIPGQPGALGSNWEVHFSDWPAPSTKPTKFFLGQGGALLPNKPGQSAAASYLSDPAARPARTLGDNAQSDSWKAQPPYDWRPLAAGKGLGFVTPTLDRDTFIAGPSSVDLWLKSSKRNTDIQVTLTEVRPDGKETYVQNGWLRATHRTLDKKASTANDPIQTWLAKDKKWLKKGKYNYERIQIFPVAHVFRKGSAIRLNIQAPGGDRTIWNFDTIEKGKTRNTIGLGGAIPSKLVLPIIPNQDAQGTSLPPATALRGEPSRTYVAASNGG